jgi:hypothetical protein
VIADRIGSKPDDPAIALLELRHQPGHVASSVVQQTGVKSFGWENKIAQPSSIHSSN